MSTHAGTGTARDPYRVRPDEAVESGWHSVGIGVPPAYVYVVSLTRDEARALAWIADRYPSAECLHEHMWSADDEDEDGYVIRLREPDAWEYLRTLDEDEDGSPLVPPCAGGTLADKLVRLWEDVT